MDMAILTNDVLFFTGAHIPDIAMSPIAQPTKAVKPTSNTAVSPAMQPVKVIKPKSKVWGIVYLYGKPRQSAFRIFIKLSIVVRSSRVVKGLSRDSPITTTTPDNARQRQRRSILSQQRRLRCWRWRQLRPRLPRRTCMLLT